MSLPKKIKMKQQIETNRSVEMVDVILNLEEGEDANFDGFFAWYEPETKEGEIRKSFGPIFRGDNQEEATSRLETFFDEHKDQVEVVE